MSDFSAKCSRLLKSPKFVIAFRAFAFVFSVIGVLANSGVFIHSFKPIVLLFYTTQSNVLVAVFFGILLVRTITSIHGKEKQNTLSEKPYGFFPRLSAFVTLAIFVTMLIYWLILCPTSIQLVGVHAIFAFENTAVHLFTPLLMLLDYIMFTERGKLKKYDPLLGIVIPSAYLLEAIPIGLTHTVRYTEFGVDSYYPYIFLDIDQFGAWVVLMVVAILLFFFLLALLWQRLDNRIAARKKVAINSQLMESKNF